MKMKSWLKFICFSIFTTTREISSDYIYNDAQLLKISFLSDLHGGPIKPNKYETYQLLDELYGSGDFNENITVTEEVDKHFSSSVESLARLYRREKELVSDLKTYFNYPSSASTSANVLFPSVEDFLQGASVGIYRIQSMYNIPYEHMVKGTLKPGLKQSPHKMSWIDCHLLANTAKEKNDLEKNVEWLKMGVKLAEVSDNITKEHFREINKMLQEAVEAHDSAALKYGKVATNNDPPTVTKIDLYNQTLAVKKKQKVKKWHKEFKKFLDKFPMFENKPDDSFQTLVHIAYHKNITELCQSNSEYVFHNVTLKCQNLHKGVPHLRLGPVKQETLSEYPTVAIFHDFISEKECDELMEKGRNKMKATPLTIPKGLHNSNTAAYTDKRTSKIKYISHRSDMLAWKMNNRISDALEFDLNGAFVPAENYQLMNYGIGGFIELHTDSDSLNKKQMALEYPNEWILRGERLMTFMVYLSNVTLGGNTVFPLLGISVPPVKGSALFWNTITSEGLMDQRMKHLGCPVVHGDKWITNKWIKWHHHMFKFPCYPNKRFYSL